MKARIRKAELKDAEKIEEIRQKGWLETFPNEEYDITRGDVLSRFENKRRDIAVTKNLIQNSSEYFFWVAEKENEIVGFVKVRKSPYINELRALYILQNYQVKGIGTRLLNKGLEIFRSGKVYLKVAIFNSHAIKFYEKFGFVKSDRAPDFNLPSGNKIPVIYMIKSIDNR